MAEGMEKKVKAFRQRGTGGDALFIKINHELNQVLIEEECKGLADVEAGRVRLGGAEASRSRCATGAEGCSAM